MSLAVKGDDKGTLHFKSFDIDGIDPITISMFDQFFSFQTVSFSQDGPEKFFVSLDSPHTSHEWVLPFISNNKTPIKGLLSFYSNMIFFDNYYKVSMKDLL